MKPDRTASTRAALIEIMAAHQLTRAKVAELLSMPVRRYSNGTVDAWLSGRRNMPPSKLTLLQLLIQLEQSKPG